MVSSPIKTTYNLKSWTTRIKPITIVLIFALASCTKNDISYRDDAGVLIICPDNSKYTIPPVCYYFYNMDGKTAPIVCQSDSQGNFEGSVPVGNYCVVATNTDAQKVIFTGMDHYETAAVRAESTTGSRAVSDLALLSQPGDVYSIVIGNFSIINKDTLHYEPQPVLLTKNLHFNLVLKDELADEVVGIGGVLRGVYPSIHLYSQRYEDAFDEILSSAIQFEGIQTPQTHGSWGLSLSLFGIADPKGGEAYENTLTLLLTMTDNSVATTNVNMTEELSGIMEGNQGEIPLDVELKIELKKVDIAVVAKVVEWKDNSADCETTIY